MIFFEFWPIPACKYRIVTTPPLIEMGNFMTFMSQEIETIIQNWYICFFYYQGSTGCPIKKGIDRKLLFGAAQGLNLQFLNLFGFSISVSFVWCIIYRIWTHLGKVIAVFRRGMCFLAFKFSRKTAIKNASVSHCFRNSSLTIFGIIWVCLITVV